MKGKNFQTGGPQRTETLWTAHKIDLYNELEKVTDLN